MRPISVILSQLHHSKYNDPWWCVPLIVTDHLCYETAGAAIYSAIFSLTHKPAPPRQAACVAMWLCKHVAPCVTSAPIPPRPENMQRLEVMGQISVCRLGVSLVVFTKHCTTGIQSVALNNPTDALMAFDLHTETYLKSCTLASRVWKWLHWVAPFHSSKKKKVGNLYILRIRFAYLTFMTI